MVTLASTALVRRSAEELDITQLEYDALLAVREDLALGRLEHVKVADWKYGVASDRTSFNMGLWNEKEDGCGTACCIGGSMELRGAFTELNSSSIALEMLCYPKNIVYNWDLLTAQDAVTAIDNFLNGQHLTCWDFAVIKHLQRA